MKSIELTDTERQMLENLDKTGVRGKEFGRHLVKSYTGNNKTLQFLNVLKLHYALKNIGTAYYVVGENKWYFDAVDGDTYRIPEPANGIDSVLEMEFKRNDV